MTLRCETTGVKTEFIMREPTVAPAHFTRSKVLLTIDPSDTDRLKNSKQQKCHPAAGIVVKQLKEIKASLQRREP